MTRGEMRTLLRTRVADARSVRWPNDSTLDTELNASARQVSRWLGRYGLIHYTKGTESFTTVSQTRSYALSATDIRRIWSVWRTDTSVREPCGILTDLNRLQFPSNCARGKWWMFFTRNKSNGVWTANFAYDPETVGATFEVEYVALTSDIATGSGSDSSEYGDIPEDYHELVVQQAATNLLGPDDALSVKVEAKLADLRQDALEDISATNSPTEILQEWW